MKRWILNGDLLMLEDEGRLISVDSSQVYETFIELNPALSKLLAGKSSLASDIKFSRYPVDLALVISGEADLGFPIVSFEALTQKGTSFSVSAEVVAVGHVVHKRVWYPCSPEKTMTLMKLLEKTSYNPQDGRLQSLADILYLKKIAIEGGPVIDRLPDEVISSLIYKKKTDRGPKGIIAELYPYQRVGWYWLCFILREQLGGILADEMGLGKTLQVISALCDSGEKSSLGSALVLAPGSLLENWMREIAMFSPHLRALKHHGSERFGSPKDLNRFDIVVSSYDTVVRDLSLLKMIEWDVVVLDEAQNIRNPEALRTRSIKQLRRKVALAVTGTPIENRLRDLWSIMDFVIPGHLGDLNSFEEFFGNDTEAAAKLEPVVTPLMLRRRLSEVAKDLPDRIDILETLELSEFEAHLYDQMRENILAEYGSAGSLVSLVKLRQFCSHPAIMSDRIWQPECSFSKFEHLKNLIEEIFSLDEKVLVFTSYTKMADLIVNMISDKFGVMAATLDGRLEVEKRQPLIDRVSNCSGSAALILNPRAGGSGLNITSANHVIHYNPEWNPALQDQASARAYRRGQTCPVTVRRLICIGTVEEVLDERLRRKRDIAATAVIGVEGTENDYRDILSSLERSPIPERYSKI